MDDCFNISPKMKVVFLSLSLINLRLPSLAWLPGVIGNLASPVFGTPTQNTLAILEPLSKIR